MDIRRMLRQYAQFTSMRSRVLGLNQQGHHVRLRSEEALHWAIDFEKALARLKDSDRVLLLLVHGAGFAYEETARITGRKRNGMALRVAAAEAKLVDAVNDQRDENSITHLRRMCRTHEFRIENADRGLDIHAIPEAKTWD